jgi:hypothetical protein
VRVTRRAAAGEGSNGNASAAAATDSLTLYFSDTRFETTSHPLAPGVYDIESAGGTSVLVVNASREWVPQAPTLRAGPATQGATGGDAWLLSDSGWPFLFALLLLCAEWIGRRTVGQR